MSKANTLAGIISAFLVLPIWFYLIYQILQRVQASELMWFLFWIYVPATALSRVLIEVAGKE